MRCFFQLSAEFPLLGWRFFRPDTKANNTKPSFSVLLVLVLWLCWSVTSIHAACENTTIANCAILVSALGCGPLTTCTEFDISCPSCGCGGTLPTEIGCFTNLTILFPFFSSLLLF